MARKKPQQPLEEMDRIRLASNVVIVVMTTPEVFDTLAIDRSNGVVTVALPGRAPTPVPAIPFVSGAGETDNMLPSNDPAIVAARARLLGQFPDGATGSAPVPVSRAVTADQLAEQQGFDTSAIQRSIAAATGGSFAGISNEDDTDA